MVRKLRLVTLEEGKKPGKLRILHMGGVIGISCQHLQVLTTDVLQKHWECQEERNPVMKHGTVVRPTMFLVSLDIKTAFDEAKPKHVARILDDHNTHGGWLRPFWDVGIIRNGFFWKCGEPLQLQWELATRKRGSSTFVVEDGESASTTLLSSVMKCDVDIRKVLNTNVVLAVARPCFNGFLNAWRWNWRRLHPKERFWIGQLCLSFSSFPALRCTFTVQRNRICTLYVVDMETFFKEFASAWRCCSIHDEVQSSCFTKDKVRRIVAWAKRLRCAQVLLQPSFISDLFDAQIL